eukprot:COSAG06_NODE_37498_length_434_cov_1.346269_1_plen_86_part_01
MDFDSPGRRAVCKKCRPEMVMVATMVGASNHSTNTNHSTSNHNHNTNRSTNGRYRRAHPAASMSGLSQPLVAGRLVGPAGGDMESS